MTIIRSALSDAAIADLKDFCASHLKPDFDADTYANALAAESDLGDIGEYIVLEIRGIHTKTGVPATIGFEAEGDFDYEDIE